MGRIDIDCRDEKDTIIIDLAGQLDVCNSQENQPVCHAYMDRGFNKLIINLGKFTYLDSYTVSLLTTVIKYLRMRASLSWRGFKAPQKNCLVWRNCTMFFKFSPMFPR